MIVSFQLCLPNAAKFARELELLQKILIDLDFVSFGVVCKLFLRVCKAKWPLLFRSFCRDLDLNEKKFSAEVQRSAFLKPSHN